MNKLSTERAIEALYTVRAYYASLTAGYPKGKDCKGIGDVMCSEIANSCLMAIKALEKESRWIPVSERLPNIGETVLCQCQVNIYEVLKLTVDGWYHDNEHCYMEGFVIAWQPLPQPYKAESEE